jgi:uncharacterized membrane protein (DUF106 family)
MKVLNKIVIILLFTLITFSALSVFTGSVNAAGNLSCQASVSSKTSGVYQATSYTFTITNTGEANLGSANITIPSSYSNVKNLAISQEPASQNWTITEGTITKGKSDILLYGSAAGLSSGQSITFTFDATNPKPSGNYKWIIGANENTGANGLNAPEFTLDISYPIIIDSIWAATLIFLIATVIAFLNTGLNRVLINYFVGWEQYRVMQKEMNEYRSETMAAMRANDKKQVEKLKKRESQIKNMQAQMMKPQMVQFGFSFVYIIIWFFVLTPTFGGTSMVYVPGIGGLPVLYWYPIGSFFLGLLASRLIGIMPIET